TWSPHEVCLYPRALLPAATRKSIAGSDRVAGLGLSLPRLEPAHHRRMLCAKRGVARAGCGESHPEADQQLLRDKLQFWTDAAVVAQDGGAQGLRGDTRGGPNKWGAIFRAWIGDRARVQPHDLAAGQ